jgi:hypothetical protein
MYSIKFRFPQGKNFQALEAMFFREIECILKQYLNGTVRFKFF